MGSVGLVPPPLAGQQDMFLCADGTWKDGSSSELFLCADGTWKLGNSNERFLKGDATWAKMSLDVNYSLQIDTNKYVDPEAGVSYIGNLVNHATGWDAWKNEPYFKDIKPCVIKDGVVQYYLNRDDYTKKEDGSPSVLTGEDGDVMVEFPFCGWKFETSGNLITISITTEKNKDGYIYRAHSLDSEGDCDRVYVGAYLASYQNSKLHSYSGVAPVKNVNFQSFKTYARTMGKNYQIMSFYVWTMIQIMYLFVCKNLNSQSAVGAGYNSFGNNTVLNTGGSNSVPMFSKPNDVRLKCLGIEDAWGNINAYCDGIYIMSSNVYLSYKNSDYIGATSWEYKATVNSGGCNGYIIRPYLTNDLGFFPQTYSTSQDFANRYFCDYGRYSGTSAVSVGGALGYLNYQGIFCLNSVSIDGANPTYGSRLVYKHQA